MAGNIGWNNSGMEQHFRGEEVRRNAAESKPVNEQMLEWYYSMREEGKTGETKEEYASRVYAKVQAGKKLTIEELRFLERTNPALYRKALRAQNMRKMLESRLKNCKSKQEAQEIYSAAVSGVSEKDPDREMLLAALQDVFKEFTKSNAYKKLPEKEEEEKGRKQGGVDFEVDENGYQLIFTQESRIKTFAANG